MLLQIQEHRRTDKTILLQMFSIPATEPEQRAIPAAPQQQPISAPTSTAR